MTEFANGIHAVELVWLIAGGYGRASYGLFESLGEL